MHTAIYTSKMLPVSNFENIITHIFTVNLLHKSTIFTT